MAVCMVISLLKIPYVHRIYVCMYGFGQPYTLYVQCEPAHSHLFPAPLPVVIYLFDQSIPGVPMHATPPCIRHILELLSFVHKIEFGKYCIPDPKH
jgi:hypothetical protein